MGDQGPTERWRPPNNAPIWNIHEVTLHVADVMQKCAAALFGAHAFRAVERDAFPLAGITTEAEWNDALEFLRQSFAALESALRAMKSAALTERSPSTGYGRKWTVRDHIQGVALHNTYHAAQIVSAAKTAERVD